MPREPIKHSKSPTAPALAALGAHLSAGIVATVLAAVAGGIFLIAGSYAIFALLSEHVSPAWASALTALTYALILAAIALIAPAIIRSSASKAKQDSPPVKPALTTENVKLATQLGLVLIGGIAEGVLSRRSAKREATRHHYR